MSQEGIYSESKMAWWYAREGRLPLVPKQVQVILSDLCNQDCHFCAYRMSGYTSNELFMAGSEPAAFGTNNPKRIMAGKRALELLAEMHAAGVLSIQFTGGGEPTVHPGHEDIFERCIDLGLRGALVSNGVKWGERLIQSILPRFDWVRVSIDAGTQASYAAIRRVSPSHWDRAWANVRSLTTAIAAQKSNTTLGLGFVVTPTSFREVGEFTRLAKEAGAHNVRFSALFSTEDEKPFTLIYDEARALIDAAKAAYEDATFTVNDNFGSRVSDLRLGNPDYKFCAYQYYTSYIGGDLNLYRCCVLSYNKRGLLGSLKDRSFMDLWTSPEVQASMFGLDARGCERCQFNFKNRQMNDLLNPRPLHINWP